MIGFLGLNGVADHLLVPVIVGGDYTFVTNNRRDFLRLYKHIDVHAGLLSILPAARRLQETALFNRARDAIEAVGSDMTGELVEVDADGQVCFSRFPFDSNLA